MSQLKDAGVGWAIIGAMTGPNAKQNAPRPEWIEEIEDAADRAGIPVFVKNNVGLVCARQQFPRREFPNA